MPFLILMVLLVLVLGGVLTLWFAVSLIGVLLTLFVAGLVGWAADALIPGRLPGGWLGAILVGIVGGFVGPIVLRALGFAGAGGPVLFGIHIIPAFVGALVIVALFALLGGSGRRQRAY